MGLLQRDITMLHFDETYYAQKSLYELPHEDIILKNLSEVQYYCGEKSLKVIENKLRLRQKRGITYIGSGNYHYITFLLMKEIKEPFTLILFDNHTDIHLHSFNPNMISCGSWVSFALKKISQLKKVIIIGITSPIPQYPKNFPISIYPYTYLNEHQFTSILQQIPTKTTYVSIDKDVLQPTDALTNWDQGKMKLTTLLTFLKQIIKVTNVVGVDICGEMPIIERFSFSNRKDIWKNQLANMKIVETCFHSA